MNRPALTPTVFHILLSLADQDRHGYDIMRQVTVNSGGEVSIAAGTLYNALQRLVDRGQVVESGERPAPELDDERRRYYRLTDDGRALLESEIDRLSKLLSSAKQTLSLSRKPSEACG